MGVPHQSERRNQTVKRNRVMLLLLLPVVLFLWFVGWALYWIGSKQEPRKPAVTGACFQRHRVEAKERFADKDLGLKKRVENHETI